MNDVNTFIAYKMELQVPYSICAKVSQEGVLWRKTAGDRRNIKDTV